MSGPPAHTPGDVGTHENAGFFALCEAVVRQAEADIRHKCWASGCHAPNDCRRRKLTATNFLATLRSGRCPLWSDWLALAAARSNVPQVWRS